MSKTRFCRLCFTTLEELTCINSLQMQMLEIVIPRLNVYLPFCTLICKGCVKILEETFAFKSSFLEIEDNLYTYTNDSQTQIVLEKIVGISEIEDSNVKNKKVCRTCLELIEEPFVKLGVSDGLLTEVLQQCLPELSVGLTKDPVLCQKCKIILEKDFKFISPCIESEQRIINYLKDAKSGEVDLGGLLQYVQSKNNKNILPLKDHEVQRIESKTSAIQIHLENEKDSENLNENIVYLTVDDLEIRDSVGKSENNTKSTLKTISTNKKNAKSLTDSHIHAATDDAFETTKTENVVQSQMNTEIIKNKENTPEIYATNEKVTRCLKKKNIYVISNDIIVEGKDKSTVYLEGNNNQNGINSTFLTVKKVTNKLKDNNASVRSDNKTVANVKSPALSEKTTEYTESSKESALRAELTGQTYVDIAKASVDIAKTKGNGGVQSEKVENNEGGLLKALLTSQKNTFFPKESSVYVISDDDEEADPPYTLPANTNKSSKGSAGNDLRPNNSRVNKYNNKWLNLALPSSNTEGTKSQPKTCIRKEHPLTDPTEASRDPLTDSEVNEGEQTGENSQLQNPPIKRARMAEYDIREREENLKEPTNTSCHCSNCTKNLSNIKNQILRFYTCTHCCYETQDEAECDEHVLRYKLFPIQEHQRLKLNEINQVFGCTKCVFQTLDKPKMINHVLTHHVEYEFFQCCMCWREYRSKAEVKCHENRYIFATFKCPLCTFQFKERSRIKQHVQHHKNSYFYRKYYCSVCLTQCKDMSAFVSHRSTHKTAEKAVHLRCFICPYETKNEDLITGHIKNMHKETVTLEPCLNRGVNQN